MMTIGAPRAPYTREGVRHWARAFGYYVTTDLRRSRARYWITRVGGGHELIGAHDTLVAVVKRVLLDLQRRG